MIGIIWQPSRLSYRTVGFKRKVPRLNFSPDQIEICNFFLDSGHIFAMSLRGDIIPFESIKQYWLKDPQMPEQNFNES